MREHEKLAARLAKLAGSPTATSGDRVGMTSLQGRLKALAGHKDPPEGAERDLNSRLASLAVEPPDALSSAEDLNTRPSRLGTSGSAPEKHHQQQHPEKQQYYVPEVIKASFWVFAGYCLKIPSCRLLCPP